MLSDITIRTICDLCETETWHSATSGLLQMNQKGDTVERLAFKFRCPAASCEGIDQLVPLPAVAIAILWELQGVNELSVSIETELPEFNEPMTTWMGLQLEISCENKECRGKEAFPLSAFKVKPIELGYRSAALMYNACPFCEAERAVMVSSAAMQMLVLFGAEEMEWAKTAFSFICYNCESVNVLDGMMFSIELSVDENPNKIWVDLVDSVSVFLYCSSCGAEDISRVDRKENWEAILGFLKEIPLAMELSDIVTACDICGPLDIAEYPHSALPFFILAHRDDAEELFVVTMYCPRCSDIAEADFSAWLVPSGPALMELLRISGAALVRRLEVTPFSEDEISELKANIKNAKPDDFAE